MKAVALFLLIAVRVAADPVTPWARGVSAATQDQANALFADGNALFAQQKHTPALAKYRAALALWDHPLIRLNTAVTLIRLERPLEAADELEQALRFGNQPFVDKPDLYQQALDYRALLKGRISELVVTCEERGATVSLDGKPWFSGVGTHRIRVAAGAHALFAEARGFVPVSRRVVAAGGDVLREKLDLQSVESAVKIEYRFGRWVPWTVAGSGLAIGLGGLGVYLAGRQQMNEFGLHYASECPMGCSEARLSDWLRGERDGALRLGTIGTGLAIAGGAMLGTGVVLAIINRPRRVLPAVEVAPTSGGASARLEFHF